MWHFGKHLFAAVNIQKSPTTKKAVEEIIFVPYSFRIWVENNTGNGSLFPGRKCPSKIWYQINRIMFCNKLSLEATDQNLFHLARLASPCQLILQTSHVILGTQNLSDQDAEIFVINLVSTQSQKRF